MAVNTPRGAITQLPRQTQQVGVASWSLLCRLGKLLFASERWRYEPRRSPVGANRSPCNTSGLPFGSGASAARRRGVAFAAQGIAYGLQVVARGL